MKTATRRRRARPTSGVFPVVSPQSIGSREWDLVLIPLASLAGGEQARAAQLLEQAGAAITVSGTVTGLTVSAAVSGLLADPDARARLGKAARELGFPDAGARQAGLVSAVAAGEPIS